MVTPQKQFQNLIVRWLVNAFGIWVASALFASVVIEGGLLSILVAGLVLALVNAVIKPFVVILALPAILFSLGLFVVFVNGLMVLIADFLLTGLSVDGYGSAVLAGLVIGLVNYILTNITEKGSQWKTSSE